MARAVTNVNFLLIQLLGLLLGKININTRDRMLYLRKDLRSFGTSVATGAFLL
jgi:hypothetical protein